MTTPLVAGEERDLAEVVEVEQSSSPYVELGSTGLKRAGGYVDEEFLPQLRGRKAVQVYREMGDNDPICGAMLFAITQLCRNVDFPVVPGGKSTDHAKAAKHVETCMHDMSHTWADFVAEAVMGKVQYGWSWHEIVLKQRTGPWARDGSKRSQYTDGLVGWRRMPVRAQETLQRWVFDDAGGVRGMVQLAAPDYKQRILPIERSVLFRHGIHKGNPEGRALALDTPVPTPDGWRTMADLSVGDKVFDEQGRVRYVVAQITWENRSAYRLTFSDGSAIVADAAHEWPTTLVWERAKGLPASKRTTEQIAATVKNSNGVSNHAIAWAGALDYPEQLLLVDPYYFGLWLGDGTALSSDIACHADDLDETVRLIEARGYPTKVLVNGGSKNGRSIRVYGGARASLRELGVQGDKHVPAGYLRGSVAQRKALLAGLMDSDGHVDAYGRCEFVNTNRTLIDATAELVRSLGVGCSITLRRHAVEGERSTTWAVRFTPTESPFRLERKTAAVKPARRREQHYIVKVERVEDQDTKCIEVDAPSHLFLAGESMVPTSNSMLRTAYRPWFYKKRLEEFESVGVERDLAGLPMVTVPAEYLRAAKGTDQAKMVDAMKRMVRAIRRNEQEGLVFPAAYDSDTKQPLFKFELLGSGGARQFSTNELITRYEQRILMTCLADFILVGHEQTGSYNMHVDKTGIFRAAINQIIQSFADDLNRHVIPKLFAANGWKPAELPKIKPSDVDAPDLAQLSGFLTATAGLGFNWGPDADMERYLRNAAGMPELGDDDYSKRRQLARKTEATRMAETQTAYLAARSTLADAQAQQEMAAAGEMMPEEAQAMAEQQAGAEQQQGQAAQQQAQAEADGQKTQFDQGMSEQDMKLKQRQQQMAEMQARTEAMAASQGPRPSGNTARSGTAKGKRQ